MFTRYVWIIAPLFVAGCGGGINILPEPFTRERADGKIPVKVELIRKQVRAELDGVPEGEAEVLRWQAIEKDYNECRLSSAESSKEKAEEVFAVCMSQRDYVYMYPVDAEQFHWDIAEEEERLYPERKRAEEEARIAAEKKAEEERIAAEKKAEEERIAAEQKAAARDRELKQRAADRLAAKNRSRAKCSNYSHYKGDLISAIRKRKIKKIRDLIEDKCADPSAGLNLAISRQYYQIFNILMSAYADPNTIDKNGRSPLIYSVIGDSLSKLLNESYEFGIKHGNYNMGKKWKPNTLIVNALLDAGADVNHRDDWDKTAMDYAKEEGYPGIVGILRAAGAKE